MKSSKVHDFIEELSLIAPYHDHMRLFSDWLYIVALAYHQSAYHAGLLPKDALFDEKESAYMEAIRPYNREQLDGFCRLTAIAQLALRRWERDFLGSVFMELQGRSSKQAVGQFFTPFELSYMMAMMSFHDIVEHIAENGYATLSEPACGAGGMLIAAAKYFKQQNIDQRLVFFQAIDINRNCFLMTYIQTCFLQMTGYVIQGNTLSGEQFNVWATPGLQVFQYQKPGLFAWAKDIVPKRSSEVVSPPISHNGQLVLF